MISLMDGSFNQQLNSESAMNRQFDSVVNQIPLLNEMTTIAFNWSMNLADTIDNGSDPNVPNTLYDTRMNSSPLHQTQPNSTEENLFTDLTSPAYYGEAFFHFNQQYRQVHGTLSLFVCVFGIIANVLNIIVLTRKNMVSPTNAILTGMAVSDLLVIASYIPFVIHNFMRRQVPLEDMYTYGWAVFTLIHAHNTVVFHTISIWLTVLLAVWRYRTVRTQSSKSHCSISRALCMIALTYMIVPLFCIPVFFCFTIQPFTHYQLPNATLYKVDIIQIDGQKEQLVEKINFWAFSVLLKLIPCFMLTVLSLALIRILIDARKRKERLLGGNLSHRNVSSVNHQHHHHHHHHNHQANVTKSHGGSNNYLSGQIRRESGATTPSGVILSPTRPSNMRITQPNVAGNQLYLEIADPSPTECDQSSKSSKASSHQDNHQTKLQTILEWCTNTYHIVISVFTQCFACCCCWCWCCERVPIVNKCLRTNGEVTAKLKSTTTTTTTTLTTNTGTALKVGGGPNVSIHHHRHHHSHHISHNSSERTTRMLIAVLIMFLVCEFPSGILALLSAILGKPFFNNVYTNFGELMDMMALINSAVNFVLYCLMSQQFRKTFRQLFFRKFYWTEVENKGSSGANVCNVRTTGQHRLSNARPEATVATEIIGTPPDENYYNNNNNNNNGNANVIRITNKKTIDDPDVQMQETKMIMDSTKVLDSNSSNGSKHSNRSSICTSLSRCNSSDSREMQQTIEMIPTITTSTTLTTTTTGTSFLERQPATTTNTITTVGTTIMLAANSFITVECNTQNNNGMDNHDQKPIGQFNNNCIIESCDPVGRVAANTTPNSINDETSIGSSCSNHTKSIGRQNSRPVSLNMTPTAECELVLNTIGNHMNTTSV
ncbi:hypothetical protein RDWZM_005998 [Blomia tropicalis]|uniref:G-protein coupled receptors family 1 profile domain-containing protein n=1 Tax=Blomia tropicalis TaxID=40697 RepID=A0A9Q0M690_BLOTA|nr:hypothetical protein RDWZM_005998 [Blomia tropicalis]